MFDKYVINRGPSHMSVKVEEKRAPTDESIRLYHEILEKARGEVLESLAVENELVDFYAVRLPTTDLRTRIMIAFKLNGELYVTEAPMSLMEQSLAYSKMELIRFTIKRMSEVIAEKLLSKLDSL